MNGIVNHLPTLNGMEKSGLIKFTHQTGTKISGLYSNNLFTCYYVANRCDNVPVTFEYKGAMYCLEYFSGCFYPYVVYVCSVIEWKEKLRNENK